MPKWNEGLVDAFPIPLEHQLQNLTFRHPSLSISPELSPLSGPFPFFDLPAEIRNRIYNLILFSRPCSRLSSSYRHSRLAILLVSKRCHLEASYALYTTHKFLIFPVQLFNALPTIQELPLHYRILVTNLEIVVGPSWTNPPKSWRVTKSLSRCLAQLKSIRTLNVFVDFDPSHPAFRKYRISYEFYTDFCGDLVADVLDAMPQVEYVQIDGNSGVDVHGPLVTRLREEASSQEKNVRWGKQADWGLKFDKNQLKEYEANEEIRTTVGEDTRNNEGGSAEKATRTTSSSTKGKSTRSSKSTTTGQSSRSSRMKKKKDENMVLLYQ